MSPTSNTLERRRATARPRSTVKAPRRGAAVSAFTTAAQQTIGTADTADAPSLDARWRHVHESVELVVEVALAGQLFDLHRGAFGDERQDDLERSRYRVRDACADVVQRLTAAHRDLAHQGVTDDEIARHADLVKQRWQDDPEGAVTALPTLLARELSEALKDRGTTGDPGTPIAEAAGTALALWLLTDAEHDPARVRPTAA
ncbi:hypothetical protein AB0L40_08995 [Patulibacter sp. NPDC049589]|uniref:hypothetical protein n=1 Tax=Patulibacter sp. NPDC049589 TaxID=3154731 RepID=UPI00341DAAE3